LLRPRRYPDVLSFEKGQRVPGATWTPSEAAGVEFIPENGGGAGVRLQKGEPE